MSFVTSVCCSALNVDMAAACFTLGTNEFLLSVSSVRYVQLDPDLMSHQSWF